MWLQQRYRAASALAQKDVGLRPLMLCKSDDEFFRRLLHQGTAPSANNEKITVFSNFVIVKLLYLWSVWSSCQVGKHICFFT